VSGQGFDPRAALRGLVSTDNSSSALLGAGASFAGVAEEVTDYAMVYVTVFASHASATNGLAIEQSSDGVAWDFVDSFTILAATTKSFSVQAALRFLRVRYTNGATPQTAFRLQTVYKQVYGKPSTHKVQAGIVGEDDCELVKAVVAGQSAGKVFNIAATAGGLLAAATAGEAVAAGVVAGTVDVISGRVTTAATVQVAVRNTAYVEQAANAQRSLASTSALDAAAGTGARAVRLTYYSLVAGVITGPFTEDVTLNGVLPVDTVATNICYVERIEVVTAGVGGTNAGVVTLFAAAAGLGGVVASIAIGDGRTYYAHHYVPSGEFCFVECLYASSTAGSANVPLFVATQRNPTLATSVRRPIIDHYRVQGSGGLVGHNFRVPRVVAGPAVIEFLVTPANGAVQVQAVDASFVEV
jgi:hypothetical protein